MLMLTKTVNLKQYTCQIIEVPSVRQFEKKSVSPHGVIAVIHFWTRTVQPKKEKQKKEKEATMELSFLCCIAFFDVVNSKLHNCRQSDLLVDFCIESPC